MSYAVYDSKVAYDMTCEMLGEIGELKRKQNGWEEKRKV
jgi:hypothetical protein